MISNVISFFLGTIAMLIFIVYFIQDDFEKLSFDLIKFVVLPIITVAIGFYQWKKVLLNKQFAEKQLTAIVDLLNELTKINIPIYFHNNGILLFKFDRDFSRFLLGMNTNPDANIYLTGDIEKNPLYIAMRTLEEVRKNVFLPLSISKIFNKLEMSMWSTIGAEQLPDEYFTIGGTIDVDLNWLNLHNPLSLNELFRIKDDLFKEIDQWLKKNSIDEKLNIESNRYA